MKLLNTDTLFLLDLEDTSNSELLLNLGKPINDKICSNIVIDSSVINNSKEETKASFGVSGVSTPILHKDGVDYANSNVLFTGVYIEKDNKVSLYEELILLGTKEALSKVKIIAGGYSKTYYGTDALNLVLKVPTDCFYGVVGDSVYYDCYNESTDYTIEDIDNICKDLCVSTLLDILLNDNILPPRGVYNKTLYRHFKGNWYLVEGVGKYVDTDKTLVSYRALYGNYGLYFRDKFMFTSENEKKSEYPLQDYRFMTLKELEYCLGSTSEEFMSILTEYNTLINEHPFIIGL